MPSKTRESGRADILVRMTPRFKEHIVKAATEDGLTTNDWILDHLKDALAVHDAEVAARERKQDLESRIERKFREVMASLAGGDLTGLKAQAFAKLQEKAEAAIEKWRIHGASHHYAEPRTRLEALCKEHEDLEAELKGAQRLDTFHDEGFGFDLDDPDDGDEPEPDHGDAPEPDPGDE